LLYQEPLKDGRYCRVPTEYGQSSGIHREEIKGENGNNYIGNTYSRQAQKYILKNLYAIFMFNKGESVISDRVREDIRKSRALFELKDCGVDMDKTAQVEKVTKRSCNNCMVLRRGDCVGGQDTCDYYKFSPTIEMK
jgi:hypothetical protein